MIPTDSADAREILEREAATQAAKADQDALHAVLCRDGWLGEDRADRPIPCPRCRPDAWPCACPVCAMPAGPCDRLARRRHRRCCDACQHNPIPDVDAAVSLSLALGGSDV